jgi:hypothetical protein
MRNRASHVAAIFAAGSVSSQQRHGTRSRRLGIMLKRVAYLGFSAAMTIAANPPGTAKAWDGCWGYSCYPRYYNCYWCYPRYHPGYRWRGGYTHYYSDYPRGGYVRYGRGYDPYDGYYRYRYYSAYGYDDRYGYDW